MTIDQMAVMFAGPFVLLAVALGLTIYSWRVLDGLHRNESPPDGARGSRGRR